MLRAEADAVGCSAVGPNLQTLRDSRDGRLVGHVSSGDGPVQYRHRPPAEKPNGTIQANIETFVQGQRAPLATTTSTSPIRRGGTPQNALPRLQLGSPYWLLRGATTIVGIVGAVP